VIVLDIGSAIRYIRDSKGMTITALAKEIGTTRPYLSDIERGTKKPSFNMLEKICQALNITLDDLFLSESFQIKVIRTAFDDAGMDIDNIDLDDLRKVVQMYKIINNKSDTKG
jgi:transcriptional regulator with XRE-family HTH domain